MMNKMMNKHGVNLRPGQIIIGKWHKQHYVIKRKLGSGTVGSVYLCHAKGKQVALKISEQNASIITEVNVLRALEQVQGSNLGPRLLDVDDWVMVTPTHTKTYSFYVMEYIQGVDIGHFIRQHGKEWLGVFLLQLLTDLERLHQAGWVFGDLKRENLIVTSSPPKVRLIDVGGTTQIGRSIKEYTEFYDRGYWGLGSRKAEPSYDLFALTMVFVSIYVPDQLVKTLQPKNDLVRLIRSIPDLKPYHMIFEKAVMGRYLSSSQMKQDVINHLYSRRHRHRHQRNMEQKIVNHIPILIETGGILCVVLIYYVTSLLF